MKLDYSFQDITRILTDRSIDSEANIQSIAYDSRRISNGNGVLFFALNGRFRNGHDFIKDAYQRGVRHFIVSRMDALEGLDDAQGVSVENTMDALIQLASYHRNRFTCPVVAITGSNGKTTVKEWLSELLSNQFDVARSPKSYNSTLGVAISLLEITPNTEVALIEVGVTEKGGMDTIERMVRPTHGILTSFGSAHRELFEDDSEHLNEKLVLFKGLSEFIYPASIEQALFNGIQVPDTAFAEVIEDTHVIHRQNAQLAATMAQSLGVKIDEINRGLKKLRSLALRLESYNGHKGNTIINDTYSLDDDSLRLSLAYQLANANGKRRVVLIGLNTEEAHRKASIEQIIAEYSPDEWRFCAQDDIISESYSNSCVLIKGSRATQMEKIAQQFKQQNHQTYLEIDLTAIRHNINYHKSLLNPETRLLCMVKASSYGSDARTMGIFLESLGVDHLGVAYVDEGVELRKSGVQLPILVMNSEENAFSQCIEFNLEPAIFSTEQLDAFITHLIAQGKTDYPVHIKLETGMNRLGFDSADLKSLTCLVKGQPEVYIKSVYTHLAEADVLHSVFTASQISKFKELADQLSNEFAHPILRHALNSSGIENYPEAQLDMVRLGIGMYGVNAHDHLRPALSWFSCISQVKMVKGGDSVGYSRAFVAEQPTTIAVIPVGYADGFRRSLGNGIGGVYIGEQYCPTVGNVCMDMIMVDVTGLKVAAGDRVEIIGNHQPIAAFAQAMQTIPYEVMTGISQRVHRVFVDH